VGRAVHIRHGKRPYLHSDSIYHKRFAFVMADGITIPRWLYLRRMRLIQANVTDFVVKGVKYGDFVLLLEHLHAEVPENVRYTSGPTLVAWCRVGRSGQRDFTVFSHNFRCLGF